MYNYLVDFDDVNKDERRGGKNIYSSFFFV